MTLSQQAVAAAHPQRTVPVLKTERLVLRAPRGEDAPAIAGLLADRRIAINTSRIPYPYGIDDAEQFIASVNRLDGEATFVITLDGAPIFEKSKLGRHAQPGEVIRLIASATAK